MAGDGDGKQLKTPPGSPPKKPGKGDGAGGSGETVRVVREIVGAAPNWPKLTKTNYTQWLLVMKVKMQARNLWEAIEPGGVSFREDRMALDAITSVVPPEMVAALAAKETMLEVWNAVKARRVGGDQVQKTEAQRLLREFENIKFTAGKSVDDFTIRLQNLVAELETVGETVARRRVVEKLLRVVPKTLRQVAVAIQVSADLSTLSLEDASGRLRAAHEADAEDDEAPPPHADGKLYLTKEEWEAQAQQRGGGASSGSRPGGTGTRRGRARRAPTGSGGDAGPGQKLAADQCRRCKKKGH
jgi:hypothetical protein